MNMSGCKAYKQASPEAAKCKPVAVEWGTMFNTDLGTVLLAD